MASITHRRNAVLGAAFLMATSAHRAWVFNSNRNLYKYFISKFWLCYFIINFVRYWGST